ncbi:MAG: hypothetical protein JWR22_1224 [Herminiimonas sp.]|nr:hypothetical protein [Herminiimonas sp.]
MRCSSIRLVPVESGAWRVAVALAWTVALAWLFAHVEIEIEGGSGWAASLPTWRVEQHWALDLFWGGRAMTGYHAWMFPFIALAFHYPFAFGQRWDWRAECKAMACIMVFWISEDALWFAINPAWGMDRFHAAAVPWHKHWIAGLPTDYWVFGTAAVALLFAASVKPASVVGAVDASTRDPWSGQTE